MVPDVFYRGYRIVSDVEEDPGTGFWKARAAVVKAADALGVERICRVVPTAYLRTEKEARDFLIAEAKKWIDAEPSTA